jgi:carbonyl reductase 1
MSAAQKKVFVTGANTGIGFALCKQLAIEDNCHVFLGSRSEERGREAVASILSESPGAKVELVVIDVSIDESVKAAAASLAGQKPFHAIVNNAGAGLAHGVTGELIIDINVTGAKRVINAFLPLVNPDGGRLVGTSSGVASVYVNGEGMGKKMGAVPVADRQVLTNFDVTLDQINSLLEAERVGNYGESEETKSTHHSGPMGAYGVSKAALTAYYMLLAKENPNLVVSTCSPGFIDTNMTRGFGAGDIYAYTVYIVMYVLNIKCIYRLTASGGNSFFAKVYSRRFASGMQRMVLRERWIT